MAKTKSAYLVPVATQEAGMDVQINFARPEIGQRTVEDEDEDSSWNESRGYFAGPSAATGRCRARHRSGCA
eukprot:15434684-Alexandrium_andersonii.AAC.1